MRHGNEETKSWLSQTTRRSYDRLWSQQMPAFPNPCDAYTSAIHCQHSFYILPKPHNIQSILSNILTHSANPSAPTVTPATTAHSLSPEHFELGTFAFSSSVILLMTECLAVQVPYSCEERSSWGDYSESLALAASGANHGYLSRSRLRNCQMSLSPGVLIAPPAAASVKVEVEVWILGVELVWASADD